jgi:hypothetical protein
VFEFFCNVLIKDVHFFCFDGTGVWTQGFVLPRQALYHLNNASSSFSSGYFCDRVSLFAWARLDCDSLILCFLLLLGCYRITPPGPAFFYWDGVSWTFLPGLAWNHNPTLLSPPYSLGWQACATVPSYWLKWILWTFCLGWPQTVILLILAS